MPDLIGRPLYTATMAAHRLGLTEAVFRERVAAGELPAPLRADRWDARAIDKLYWTGWAERKARWAQKEPPA